MTLYHVSWCPECADVRDKLADLKVPYEDVIVPDARSSRREVFEVSGQYYVPVLKDGETVLTETDEILEFLDERYGRGKGKGPTGNDEGGDEAPCCSL
jgi:mycoredoxin